jgi:phosphate transport system substrate-binding protein
MLTPIRTFGLGASFLALAACTTATGRDQISIVGSSTVFPFSSAVAEHFAARGQFRTPKVESTGTGGGIAIFCRGIGINGADIANASRRMKKSEFEECVSNGVTDIVELKIGSDGIVLANTKSGPEMELTKQQIFLALAKEIPGPDGAFIPNPYKSWNEIDPSLPDLAIDVMGPPPTSGTRDAFNELVLEKGAATIPVMAALKEEDGDAFKARAHTLREDGAWKDSGENDNLIVQALTRNPNQFGVFGYSFYEENTDRMRAVPLNGLMPTFEAISSGEYAAARSLYFYVKKQHVGVIPGLAEYTREFLSVRSAGPRGYLRGRGMVPLTDAELVAQENIARTMTVMVAPEK